MLLRRVIEHVKAQNWTAVALDFVIVVVGVFIGIQVANWNAARAERKLGEDYTVRLIADLENDLAGARTQTSYYDDVTKSIETTDRLLASPDPDPQALVIAAYRASEFSNNPPNRATWDQIVRTPTRTPVRGCRTRRTDGRFVHSFPWTCRSQCVRGVAMCLTTSRSLSAS